MKRISALFLSVIFALSVFAFIPLNADAESMYIKKIVSVVYDDSGSMKGDKWAYANYAIQAFCGMLNSEDQLYITYMSQVIKENGYSPEKVDLSSGGIQNSIDTIMRHKESSSTPFRAVELAYDKLKSVQNSNPNTQYWLVVITDGVFDEISSHSAQSRKSYLNQKFSAFKSSQMPNGSYPQITFLSIGNNVVAPDANESGGLYTYSAESADEIINAMSQMAHKVSGRTRVSSENITSTSDTVTISSTIPLLSIAVVSQKTDAKIEKATADKSKKLAVSRSATLKYPDYNDLIGKTFLVGKSGKNIDSGTYTIKFDKPVSTDNIVILFEPALEARLFLSVNGKEIKNHGDLKNLTAGDKISASYKMYEMGKDKVVDSSLLPPGTNYKISVYEDGKEVPGISSESEIIDYVLTDKLTEIKASVSIKDFNPIEASVKFTPARFGSGDSFSIKSDYINSSRSVRYSDISSNKDMGIEFTVLKDNKPVTDVELVKKATPEFNISPSGNEGEITYSDDGKILFIPKKASSSNVDKFDVTVSCTIGGEHTATATYTVLVADYQITPVGDIPTIKKTQFKDNTRGVSFIVTKNGKRLSKSEIGSNIAATTDKNHDYLKTKTVINDDGTVTVIPYNEDDHKLTFSSWWFNWAYYFGLDGRDCDITLYNEYGDATSTIDITGEDFLYQLFNVYLPLLIELILLGIFLNWIFLVVTKPRYQKGAKLYVGEIYYDSRNFSHILRNFVEEDLTYYNAIRKGNGRLKYKKEADVVSPGGVDIRADHGGRIICTMEMPWYRGVITPRERMLVNTLKLPHQLAEYFENHSRLEILEFATTEAINGDNDHTIYPQQPYLDGMAEYTVVPDSIDGVRVVGGRTVIKSGYIFIYTN